MPGGITIRAATAIAAMLALGLTLGAGRADARCQVQWEPDPFGDSGGSLGIICGDPSAPTGNVDGDSGKKAKKKKRKPPPSHASIVVNETTLNDGDLSFNGAYSAGYAKKRAAVRAAERACRREFGGVCKSWITARNGWAALVATLRHDGSLTVFGGRGKTHSAAFADAERRARAAFGGSTPHEIQRVRAVRTRAR